MKFDVSRWSNATLSRARCAGASLSCRETYTSPAINLWLQELLGEQDVRIILATSFRSTINEIQFSATRLWQRNITNALKIGLVWKSREAGSFVTCTVVRSEFTYCRCTNCEDFLIGEESNVHFNCWHTSWGTAVQVPCCEFSVKSAQLETIFVCILTLTVPQTLS